MSCCNNNYSSNQEGMLIVNKTREAAACAQANCASSFTNATNAATSATNSANSAAASAASAAAAATSETNTENLWEQFNALYLGSFAVAPTVDNQGNPLQEGALYWNSVTNEMFVWNGSAWTPDAFNQFTNFTATGTTTARNLVTRMADVVNVKDFGAVGDGVTDDTAAIQAAINQAQLLNTSCVVYIPATQFSYRTTATLTITRNIKLVGDCILTPQSNTPATKVSKLYFDHLGIGINITGGNARGTWVEGLELERKQPAPSTVVPTPWTPAAADFDIVVSSNAYSVTITDCLISSATKAIKAFSLGFGQLNVLNCKIWAFDIGMEFDGCYDVCRIDNVHIWPFRLQNQNVYDYTRNNLIGILTKRNDNPKISNFFTYACKYGIQFSGSSFGITERAELNNCGFDRNGQAGIYFAVGSNYSSALISNCYCARGEYAIKCDASVITAQISNFRSSIVNKNAINITGGTLNNFQITNLALDSWDQDLANNPAIVCPSGTSNRLFITGDILVETGGTPPVAAPVIGNIGGIDSFEWFNQTATLSSDTGTITDANCSIFIRKQNKTLKFEIAIEIIDAGTAGGGLRISMPYNAGFRNIQTGRILNTAEALCGNTSSPSNIVTVKKYDGSTAIATGNIINITGEYYTGL